MLRSVGLPLLGVLLFATIPAVADITEGFEGTGPYLRGDAFRTCGDPSYVHSGLCSANLSLSDTSTDSGAAGLDLGSGVRLSQINYTSIWAIVPTTNSVHFLPYIDYYVDSSHDGNIEAVPTDSLVILANGASDQTGSWQNVILNGTSLVHVVGNRSGLASNAFTAGNPGTLTSLMAISLGDGSGLTWGDLAVGRARAEAGTWGDGQTPSGVAYSAYVDDVTVATPEPGALECLTAMLGGLLVVRRKVRCQ